MTSKILSEIQKKAKKLNKTIVLPEGNDKRVVQAAKILEKKKLANIILIQDKTDLILRCSGLMGYNRIAGKRSSNKVVNDKDIKVNYVHRDDVISATLFAILNNINGIFNLCVEEHPTKEEIYLFNSKKYNFKESIFKDEKGLKNRIIDGSKIENLGFKYKYSNPFDFI